MVEGGIFTAMSEQLLSKEALNPIVKKYYLQLTPPSLEDNTADIDRIKKYLKSKLAIDNIHVSLKNIARFSRVLRQANFKGTVTVLNELDRSRLIDMEAGDTTDRNYGIAVDLGTATLMFYLLDLYTGKIIDQISAYNPQIRFGEDILTRIHHAGKGDGFNELKECIIDSFNRHIRLIAEKNHCSLNNIYVLAVAGNTTMTHLFLGLQPATICREPYIPIINKPDLFLASEVNLSIGTNGHVLVFPNVGSYVGGDLIAGILFSEIYKNSKTSILLDVGTNVEVILGNSEWLIACAGAGGPALEGGAVKIGTMASQGAIDKVRINPVTLEPTYSTIGDTKPKGICGSGLIDLIAEMFLSKIIDSQGKVTGNLNSHRIVKTHEGMGYVLAFKEETAGGQDLIISEADISVLLRSKAAMYTILTTISSMVDIKFQHLKHFFIAGTFGNYLDPKMAITIGMIPDIPIDRYKVIGNSSGLGACIALLSNKKREDISRICDGITYVELNVNTAFMSLFNAARFIPHTDRSLFPSVKI